MKERSATEMKSTLLFALLFLFFLQLLSLWIESIYRLTLVKLSMGMEGFSFLWLLLPLVVLFSGRKSERPMLWFSLLTFLGARAVCPLLGVRALTVVAGLGVAAFLILLCVVFSGRYRSLQGDACLATGIAVLLSVLFRSWGSSCDISMEGNGAVLGWVLVGAALGLCVWVRAPEEETGGTEAGPVRAALLPMLGLFSNIAIIYFVLSSPAVVSAWSGANHLVSTSLFVIALAAFLVLDARRPAPACACPPWRAGVISALFVALLVLGICLNRPALPASPEAAPWFTSPAAGWRHLPFYGMFLLAPVVAFNVRLCTVRIGFGCARNAVLPVMLGACVLVLLTTMLIFTNVWGYVGPFGPLLRNRFFLPFLLAGLGMLLSGAVSSTRAAQETRVQSRPGLTGAVAAVIAVLAIAGVLARTSRPGPAPSQQKTLLVMTYNMQQGSDARGDRSYREQLDFLRRVGADIIGLQESDTPRPSGGHVNAVRYFADGLGFYSYYGPNTLSGTFGTAILSRYPLENPRTFFTFSDQDETATAMADIVVGGRRITFFDSHPAGSDVSHTAHVEALLAEAAKHDYVVAVGDYNFDQDSMWYGRVTAPLGDSWLSVYPDAIGKPSPISMEQPPAEGRRRGKRSRILADGRLDMRRRIDHIFLSRDFQVRESYYLPPPASMTDHPAHWSLVSWE